MFEAVVPVRIFEADREYRVACERQRVATRSYAYHAVTWRMPTGATDDDPRRNLVCLVEQSKMVVIFFREALGGRAQRVGKALWHGRLGKVRRIPESNLCSGDMDLQIRP